MLAGAILGAGIVAIAFATSEPILWLLAVLTGLLLIGLIYLARRDGWQIFGPVLRYELLRSARQGRAFSLRCLYAVVLLIVLFLVYTQWFGRASRDPWRFLWDSGKLPIDDLAGFANSFSSAFLAAQMLTVYLLTPLFAAGTIAGERERGTLDHLLVTHLHDREIVLGKLASRLASLTLLVLTGLPVLGLMLFLGGVDPNLVLVGFLASLATMASIGSLGVLVSIRATSTRQAAVHTYLIVIGYLALSFPCMGCGCVGDIPAAGNIVVAAYDVLGGPRSSGMSQDLAWIGLRYVAFHVLVAGVCSGWSMLRLRGHARRPEVALKRKIRAPAPAAPPLRAVGAVLVAETTPPALAPAPSRPHHVILRPQFYREGTATLRRPRPRPSDQPLLWKELHVETALPGHGAARASAVILFLCILMGTGLVCLVALLAWLSGGRADDFANPWTRYVGSSVAYLLLLVVAVRAAASFSGERDRQTLDNLLTTPLDNQTILTAKWLGSILSVRKGWWALAAIGGLGVLGGGVPVFALPVLATAWAVYALFLAGVGILCSLLCRSTLRATIWTLGIALTVNVLPWAVELFWDLLAYAFDFRDNALGDLATVALSPPMTFSYLGSFHLDLEGARWPVKHTPQTRLAAALLGLILYALAAWILWSTIRARFGRLAGRMPI